LTYIKFLKALSQIIKDYVDIIKSE